MDIENEDSPCNIVRQERQEADAEDKALEKEVIAALRQITNELNTQVHANLIKRLEAAGWDT
jgi:hypothetical protein